MRLFFQLSRLFNQSANGSGAGIRMDREAAGIALREKRVSLGLSLDEVARTTMLRKSILESLEAGGPPQLDGFFKSYARRYAGFLGMDGDEVVASFCSQPQAAAAESEESPATLAKIHEHARRGAPVYTRRRSLIPIVFIAIAVLVTAVILLSRPWDAELPGPNDQAGPSNASATSQTPSDVISPSSGPTTPSDTSPTGQTPAAGSMTLRFVATTQRAWLEITSDGEVVFSGILRPGDSTQVAGNYIIVNFGNAMYTQVSINGAGQEPVSLNKTVMTVEYGSPPGTP